MDVRREIVFPAEPAEVWEALTEPERLEDWFATEVELSPEWSAAFELRALACAAV